MRVAWFSPLPPARSGVAAYSADILPLLREQVAIDTFAETPARGAHDFDAHDFVWRHRLDPYDLTVYQLGNAPCHDYMWAYLAAYPGLVVLHDARLHHARARALLQAGRASDYRAEFRFDHPGAIPHVAEYAVEGLGGPIYYWWPMLRVPMTVSRRVAVHNTRVAADLREEYPETPVDTLRMGVPVLPGGDLAAARVRRQLSIPDEAVVFAAFGKMTAEKRIAPIRHAFRALVAAQANAWLLLIGDTSEYAVAGGTDVDRDRIRTTGYVDDAELGAYLAASDVCLCLRWPSALETSASWLRCLAARKATVISDLAHLVDVPSVDLTATTASITGPAPVAVRIDLLEEERSLYLAMERLAGDPSWRTELARNGAAYWEREHTLPAMASDYLRVMRAAVETPVRHPDSLPAHFTDDFSNTVRDTAHRFGLVQGSGILDWR